MKITAVLGSPNRNGNTSVLVNEALRGALEIGAETEILFLADYRIEYCKGCLSNGAKEYCMSRGICNINDDAAALRKKLYESDGIIFASPSYGIQPTARMKNFLTDRIGMYTVYTSRLGGKYFLGLSTAGGIGAPTVAKKLAAEFAHGFFQRGYVSGSLGVHVGHDCIEKHPDALDRAYTLGRKLAVDIKTGKRYRLQHLGNRLLTALMIKPIIKKNIVSNKEHSMRAVYEDLVERSLLYGNR